jgi:nucleotide-binding universal stress UspA family protein
LRKRLKEDLMGAIICGVDDSEAAKEAARVARVLGAKLGHRLVFVRIAETASPCQKTSVRAKRQQTGERLVAAAAEEKASFIVVGSTGPRSSLFGSISAEISRRAACPVVVVPYSAHERPTDGHQHPEIAAHTAGFGVAVPETGERNETKDRDTGDFAGGIVRFSLGSRTSQS